MWQISLSVVGQALAVGAGTLLLVAAVAGWKIKSGLNAIKRRAELPPGETRLPNVVYFRQLRRWERSPNPSAPCTKVEAFMRLHRIPHVVEYPVAPGPTGRFPFIELNGKTVPESEFILEELKAVFNIRDDEGFLTPQDMAVGHMVRRAMEGMSYWSQIRLLFVDNPEYLVKNSVMPIPRSMPWLRRIAVNMLRKVYIKTLNDMGHGDLTDAQYHQEWALDIRSVAAILGDKAFLFGDKPCAFDCVVYPVLANLKGLHEGGLVSQASQVFMESPQLVAYERRFRSLIYPDWDALIRNIDGTLERHTSPPLPLAL